MGQGRAIGISQFSSAAVSIRTNHKDQHVGALRYDNRWRSENTLLPVS